MATSGELGTQTVELARGFIALLSADDTNPDVWTGALGLARASMNLRAIARGVGTNG